MKFKQKAEKILNFLKRLEMVETQEIGYHEDELLFLNMTLISLQETNNQLRIFREKKLKDYVSSKLSGGSKKSNSLRNISCNTSDFKEKILQGKNSLQNFRKSNNFPVRKSSPRNLNEGSNTERFSYKRWRNSSRQRSLDKFIPKKQDIIYENREHSNENKASYQKLRENFFGLQKRLKARKKVDFGNRNNLSNIGVNIGNNDVSQIQNLSLQKIRNSDWQNENLQKKNFSIASRLKKLNENMTQKIKKKKVPFLNLKKKRKKSPLEKRKKSPLEKRKKSPLVQRARIGHQLNMNKFQSQKQLHSINNSRRKTNNFMRKRSLDDILNFARNSEKNERKTVKKFNSRSIEKIEVKEFNNEKRKVTRKRFQIKIRDSPIKFGRITTTLESNSSDRAPNQIQENFQIKEEEIKMNEMNFDRIEIENKPGSITYRMLVRESKSAQEKKIQLQKLEQELVEIERHLKNER